MKIILTIGLFILVLISGCATRPSKRVPPPLNNRLEVLRKSIINKPNEEITQNESEELAKAYLLGLYAETKADRALSCRIFSDLSEKAHFSIKESALVHALLDCDYSKNELTRIWSRTIIPNYLKEAYFEQSLKLAIKNNLLIFEAQFSYSMIAFQKIQSEKVKLVKRAIEIAELLKDMTNLKIYMDRLKEISPLYNLEINEKNIYIIAKDFETNRKFAIARSMYKQIIDGAYPIEDKVKAYNSYRTSFKLERDLKTFLLKTFEMEQYLKIESDKNPNDQKLLEYWVDIKIALAKAVWTDHQNQKAKDILNELLSSGKGNQNQLANIQFIYGSLYMEGKDNKEAINHFKIAEKFNITDASIKENIQWAIIWNNYLSHNYKFVINKTDDFIKKSINQNFNLKLEYWKAHALIHLNSNTEANKILNSISETDPFGYYGILSSMDLELPMKPIASTIVNTTPTGIDQLDWLIAMEEKPLSQKCLKEINHEFKTTNERERAMSLYLQTEWYQGGMRQIYNIKTSIRNKITEKYINVIFPTPNFESIDKLSEKYSVPKELIFAISRQESAFVPSERSPADAFGLMQLTPEKASELSKKYKIEYSNFNSLYNSEINLELGTALLKDLRTKFSFKFVQSVAGYNASENVIANWEKSRFNGNYREFIEMIPYEETRNYVKLVFRNYIVYKRITNNKEFIIDKNFFSNNF